jgi:hypothetical protein
MRSEFPDTEVQLYVYNQCHLVSGGQGVRLETGHDDHFLCGMRYKNSRIFSKALLNSVFPRLS